MVPLFLSTMKGDDEERHRKKKGSTGLSKSSYEIPQLFYFSLFIGKVKMLKKKEVYVEKKKK